MELQRRIRQLLVAVAALCVLGGQSVGFAVVDPCQLQENQVRAATTQVSRAQRNVETCQNRVYTTQDYVINSVARAQDGIANARASGAIMRANASANFCMSFSIYGAIRCGIMRAARIAAANRRAAAMEGAAIRKYNITVQSGNLRIQRDAKRLEDAKVALAASVEAYNAAVQALQQCQAQQNVTPVPTVPPTATPVVTIVPTIVPTVVPTIVPTIAATPTPVKTVTATPTPFSLT